MKKYKIRKILGEKTVIFFRKKLCLKYVIYLFEI